MNLELAVLAISLLLSTTNIFVYSRFESHGKHLNIGVWVMKITGVFPGLVVAVWAIYALATDKESTLGMALLTAALLLVAGAAQLLALLIRKQKLPLNRTN